MRSIINWQLEMRSAGCVCVCVRVYEHIISTVEHGYNANCRASRKPALYRIPRCIEVPLYINENSPCSPLISFQHYLDRCVYIQVRVYHHVWIVTWELNILHLVDYVVRGTVYQYLDNECFDINIKQVFKFDKRFFIVLVTCFYAKATIVYPCLSSVR